MKSNLEMAIKSGAVHVEKGFMAFFPWKMTNEKCKAIYAELSDEWDFLRMGTGYILRLKEAK